MRPRQKGNFEGSGAIDRRKLAAAIWHGQNSEQRRLLNVGGAVRMELFALEPSGAYAKSIALRVTKYWLRRRESLTGLQAGVLF
jgi:hypothetical protein